MTRFYSATAQPTTLAAGCTNSATSIQVTATTGFPAAEFILALDYGGASQELVKVTSVAGTTLTVVRGFDSTTAQAHSLGAAVVHVHSADDFRLSRTHEAASTGVHGATGAVVGTTDAQALSNKDLTAGTNTFPASLATTAGAQTLTNKTIALGSNSVSGTLAQLSTAVTDDDVCGTTAFNAHAAGTVVHGATGAVVGTTNTQTLTNKTLTSPTVSSPTVTGLTLDGVNVSGAWASYTPTLGGFTLGNGTVAAKYMQIGKTVHFRFVLTLGSTTTLGAGGTNSFTLPVNAVAFHYHFVGSAVDSSASSLYTLTAHSDITLANTNVLTLGYPKSATNDQNVDSISPVTFAAGDIISISGTYEAA